ncbi:MAG: sigma-70 family RNA polymerase sigma factor [Saprospiraceae bacterium]|nr:sigma-70 family RNA polymerase sigma factor [Saprospiraceae bacterium]
MQPSLVSVVLIIKSTSKKHLTTVTQQDELVAKCLQGDRRAHFEVYQTYSKAMFNICQRMMGSREAAEDVLQNAFIDVFTKIQSYRGDATLGAWIKRIVINSCLNELKKKRIQFVSTENELADIEYDDYAEDFDLEDIARIKNAIQVLPEGYKIVFTLYPLEGYDHGEIAEILNISEGASKSQYSRAKQKLHQILTQKSKTG